VSRQELQRNTIIGFIASLLLSIVKLAAGVLGRSSALVADAVESFADTLGSMLVWQALRVASKPADDDHPYGYGKAEALASLGVGAMLVVAALYIVVKAFHEIVIPHQPPEPWTLIVLLAIIGVKELLFRVVMKGANEHESDAARADAWHHRSDAITSAAALIGVSIAVWGPQLTGINGLVMADEAAAILASGVILITARHLIRPALRELLDATSHELAAKVIAVAEQVDGVRLIEKVLVRKSGAGFHLDMHVQVDPDLSIRAAHSLGGKVKSTLRRKLPGLMTALIHVEPFETGESEDNQQSQPGAPPSGDEATARAHKNHEGLDQTPR
jgi:cation diffusion facilitator family transporter